MIKIDYSRDSLFDKHGLARLKDSYMLPTETSPQERFAYVAEKFSSNEEHAQRMYDYASKHWLSFSTPILSSGRTKHGLPISCFLPYLPDTAEGLVDTSTECRYLSMAGGGIGLGIGIRASDDKSTGVIPHLKTYDSDSLAYKQGSTRRGSIAAYLDITHPDILEFLDLRKSTGGDPDRKCLNLHHGVNITDAFMERVWALSSGKFPKTDIPLPPEELVLADKWPLIDPHSKEVKEWTSVKLLWQTILTRRMESGEPFIHWIDTSNEELHQDQKKLGLTVKQTNLCTEIILPTDEERTAVCCLSSLNLEYWDQWKDDRQFIFDVVEFLDNVIEYFITHADDKKYARAIHSALRERSIGIGAMGWHALLQSKMIPFESALATSLNNNIWTHINYEANLATEHLAVYRGACLDSTSNTRRNMSLLAIAPNASTSIILGNTSPGVEPFRANVFVQDTLSGSHVFKNKHLKVALQNVDLDTEDVWSSIIQNKGSVQHLELDDYVKDVFKTAIEIDQQWIVQHAADRQEFIDQAQSINLFFEPTVDISYLHNVHLRAWIMGLKTLYYCRSEAISRAEKVGTRIERKIIQEDNECLACQ